MLSVDLSLHSYGLQLHACPPVELSFLFLGKGFHQNPACIFPEMRVFFKIICFPLREVEIKWFSWALGETLGVFNGH